MRGGLREAPRGSTACSRFGYVVALEMLVTMVMDSSVTNLTLVKP